MVLRPRAVSSARMLGEPQSRQALGIELSTGVPCPLSFQEFYILDSKIQARISKTDQYLTRNNVRDSGAPVRDSGNTVRNSGDIVRDSGTNVRNSG